VIVDPCDCGLTPQIKEIKTIVYVAICPCGKHGPARQIREWAITEWNRKLADGDHVEARAMNSAPAHP